MGGKAFIVRRKGYVTLITPYNAGFVENIKYIPSFARRWNPSSKTWDIFKPYIKDAIKIAEQNFAIVETLYAEKVVTFDVEADPDNSGEDSPKQQRWNTHTNSGFGGWQDLKSDAFTALGLLPTAGEKLIKSAYRILSQDVHPDTGGNQAQFIKLTEHYEQALRIAQAKGRK